MRGRGEKRMSRTPCPRCRKWLYPTERRKTVGTRFTVTFERDMDEISKGGFGLWLDSTIRASAEDDPESDHGPFQITVSTT